LELLKRIKKEYSIGFLEWIKLGRELREEVVLVLVFAGGSSKRMGAKSM
jgi:hypothetical protein